jgi:hypothetical protein
MTFVLSSVSVFNFFQKIYFGAFDINIHQLVPKGCFFSGIVCLVGKEEPSKLSKICLRFFL